MQQLKEYTFGSNNGVSKIYGRSWHPDGPVRGTVQIAHGIAEYVERYDPFMQFLAQQGYAVFASDHIGHGRSVENADELGYVGESSGWNVMVSDMLTLHEIAEKEYPNVPHFLFGHSMGSFLSRTFIIKHGEKLDGVILCGTGHQRQHMITGGRGLTNLEIRRHGAAYRSELLNKLMFGSYNDGFESPRTESDWLSRDTNVVDAYLADPLCGFIPSAGLVSELLRGLNFVTSAKNIERMPKELPVFFISGGADPVGENGKGVMRAYKSFMDAGMKDVQLKLYPGARHELLNETNREDVYHDVLNWLNEHNQ